MREEFAGDECTIGQLSRSTRWNLGYAQANVDQSCRLPSLRKELQRLQKGRSKRRDATFVGALVSHAEAGRPGQGGQEVVDDGVSS